MHKERTSRRREKGEEIFFKEIMAEHFPILIKKKKPIIYPFGKFNKLQDPKRFTNRPMMIKILKVKDQEKI